MEKKISGLSRKERRRNRRSNYDGFLEIFNFFLNGYRHELIDFCGSYPVKTVLDRKAPDAKFCFTAYNNGEYSIEELEKGIPTKQPNVLSAVIQGKKGWGLWNQVWAEGVASFDFTEIEILKQFEDKGIKIPEQFLKDFKNTWRKKRNDLYNNPKFYGNL